MSVRVITEVLEHSQAEHGARLVAFVLADAAHPDGIVWLGQPQLARLAKLSERAVRDGLAELVALDEVEVRKAQRGRKRINVYRVIVGSIGAVDPAYDELPFAIATPFSRPADIAARRSGDDRQELPVPTTGRPAESGTDDRQNPAGAEAPLPIGVEPSGEPSNDSTSHSRTVAAKKAELEQAVSDVWDAVEDALGHKAPTITVHRREFARLVRMLVVEVGATPDEVKRRAAAYRQHETLGRVMFTLPALVKWWHAFDGGADGKTRTAFAATEAYVRNLAHVLDENDVIVELRDRLERTLITREQAIELLGLYRDIHREAHGASPEAAPVEDFTVADTIDRSLRIAS